MIGSRAYCVNTTDLTFAEAEDACREMRGHLVTISDKAEEEALRAKLTTKWRLSVGPSFWIGLVEPRREGEWRWVTTERATFFNWRAGEPNDSGGEDCVEWGPWDGRFNDMNCFAERPFLCQAELPKGGVRGASASSAPLACSGDGQRFVANEVVYCAHSTMRNFSDAQAECQKSGGNLAVIRSAADNDAIMEVLSGPLGGADSVWIGFTDEAEEGRFVWTSGEAAGFTSWNGGEPNNSGEEDCGTWIANSGLWNDRACGAKLWSLCEGSATE